VELGPKVRVYAVAPAVVKTRFAEALYEGWEAEVAAGHPAGQTLVLDGGRWSVGR
jgi:NAD(P)-dependent dehydrogenase (short-subunit alcohol dehydrogenase family)